ncbi:MAG: hypothetical protein KDC57_17725 [Saprospiraceae bacterium]|nr:hypothetical protein [Saprospiraceae bacterium]
MKRFDIIGKAAKQKIGTGFWGIVDDEGNHWRPINMPDQLKVEGATVHCTVVEAKEDMSIFMWGTPVHIISFHTPALAW